MNRVDEPRVSREGADAERVVDLAGGDELSVLPDQTADDTDRSWGDYPVSNDDFLLAERPPHWGF
ncbi:MAG TPA: hypothetical protein VFX61_03295 [Micromonosporaceae bacterium]|nr:hypothetical protein [Micromonosporaceae bacterium]